MLFCVYSQVLILRFLESCQSDGQLTKVVPWLVHLAAHLTPPQWCPRYLGVACLCLLIWQSRTPVWNPVIVREEITENKLSDRWKMTASDMNEEKECRRVSGQSMGICCRCRVEIEGDGAHSSSIHRRDWRAAGCVAVNSIWSLVLWNWEVWSSALLNPRKTFDNNLGNNTETSSVPYIQAPLSLLCLCSQRAQTKLHWGTKDQVVCTSDLLNFLQILCVYFSFFFFFFFYRKHINVFTKIQPQPRSHHHMLIEQLLTLFSVIVCCSHIVSSSMPGFCKEKKTKKTNTHTTMMRTDWANKY